MSDAPRIGVNALFLQPAHNRGTYTYVQNLLRVWKEQGTQVILFCNRRSTELFRGCGHRIVVCRIDGGNRVVRIGYEQLVLERVARREGCQVLFCPGYLSPVSSRLPVVVTVHDMQYRDVPEAFSFGMRLAYRLILPRGVANAKVVLAVSAFARTRLVQLLGVEPHKVQVTYEGPLRSIRPEPAPELVAQVRSKYQLNRPYVLSVSSMAKYKNVERVVCAFRQMNEAFGGRFDFVHVGHHDKIYRNELTVQGAGDVRFLGYLSDQELECVYAGADAFVLGSYYEGFGLPILEAMQMGLPVACAHAASLPEVAGDAAVYFDPKSVESIRRALERVLGDELVRAECRRKGELNVARFSWEECARATLFACELAFQQGVRQGDS
jgi:glycosyltransferase involved in cell wall biosynthesis